MQSTETDGKVFKILSIDGGGFKGLYTAHLLDILEKDLGSIADHFDMICGTSTGALIALALASNMTAEQVVQFYTTWGPRIFRHRPRPVALSHSLLHFTVGRKHRYGNSTLKEALCATLGDARLCDARTYLCIPSFEVATMQPRVFKTPHAPEFTRDRDIPLVEVGLATAAAPLYFPISHLREPSGALYSYVDGGLWANDPALVGLAEAGQYFVGGDGPYESVRILSVGNVTAPTGRAAGVKHYPRSPFRWGHLLYDMAAEGQRISTGHFLRFLAPSLRFEAQYKRLEPDVLSPEQDKVIGLDIATVRAMETLTSLGCAAGHKWKTDPEVKACFTNPAAKLRPKGMENG